MFEDGLLPACEWLVLDPPKTRSVTDIFGSRPLAHWGLVLRMGDQCYLTLQPVASEGTHGCANGCMGKDSHVRPAGEVSILQESNSTSAIMPE